MSNSKQVKFTENEVDNIIKDYINGMCPKDLEIKYHRNSGTIISKLKSLGVYKNSNYRYTDEDIEFLKIYYPIGDWEKILERFQNTNKQKIQTKMSKLNIKMESFFWSDDDIRMLQDKYATCSNINDLVSIFNNKFTYKAITTKAKKLGLKTREYWSKEEIDLLVINYPNKNLDEMELILPKRNRKTIIAKAADLHIQNIVKYSKDQEKFIIDNWMFMSDEDMSIFLNKSKSGIIGKRLSLGLLRLKEKSSYNDLSEYVRRNNLEWKMESIKKCNYKCYLTGERFQSIHHIYGLNLILNETLEELNILVKETIDDYTKDELRDILDIFRIKQNNYPLGICLRDDIHKLFHNIYGYGNNTSEQWNEFVDNYKNKLINVA